MSDSVPPPTWPADVIHVNEDGWVLINRGRASGLAPGLRVFVVGSGARELRDLFASEAANADEAPVVLRTRRTYELLEIVHAEERCAVAVAARVPVARRPQFYRGPEGELLVWVPLPESYTWPPPARNAAANGDGADVGAEDTEAGGADDAGEQGDAASAPDTDAPPERGPQDDERWEQALPLNGVSVGDIVVPAVPITPLTAAPSPQAPGTSPGATGGEAPGQTTWDKSYDWMHPKSD